MCSSGRGLVWLLILQFTAAQSFAQQTADQRAVDDPDTPAVGLVSGNSAERNLPERESNSPVVEPRTFALAKSLLTYPAVVQATIVAQTLSPLGAELLERGRLLNANGDRKGAALTFVDVLDRFGKSAESVQAFEELAKLEELARQNIFT